MRTRVVIVETGHVVEGPTSFEAPFLASELLATVLPGAPADATVRIEMTGVVPTHVLRAGDRLGGPKSAIAQRGSWTLEHEHKPAVDPSMLANELCDRFSPAAADACRDYDLRLRFTFMIERLRGGLRFERDAVARIAALRAPLACYFYNMGA